MRFTFRRNFKFFATKLNNLNIWQPCWVWVCVCECRRQGAYTLRATGPQVETADMVPNHYTDLGKYGWLHSSGLFHYSL